MMKLIRRLHTSLVFLVSLCLVACSSTRVMGRRFSDKEYDQITVHKTTADDLIKRFGEPNTRADQTMTQWDYENKKFPNCGKPGEPLRWFGYTYNESGISSYKAETRNFVIDGKGLVCNKNTNSMSQSQ